jgi:hypothetical protein
MELDQLLALLGLFLVAATGLSDIVP